MPLMSSELYDALKEANVSDDTARKAAEAVANFDTRFARVETDLSHIKWSMGLGFSVLVSLSLVALNWLWQLMQKVH